MYCRAWCFCISRNICWSIHLWLLRRTDCTQRRWYAWRFGAKLLSIFLHTQRQCLLVSINWLLNADKKKYCQFYLLVSDLSLFVRSFGSALLYTSSFIVRDVSFAVNKGTNCLNVVWLFSDKSHAKIKWYRLFLCECRWYFSNLELFFSQ